VDPTSDISASDLSTGDVGRDLWEPALPHLTNALSGDQTAFLDALEGAGRVAGLGQSIPVTGLLDAYSEGSGKVRARILAGGQTTAEGTARRLLALEHVALTRIATGFSAGQGETIDRLRRTAAEASPLDLDTGAIKPTELSERLSLEVERCQRMDLSLGLVELAVDDAVGEKTPAPGRPGVLHQVGECLRDNLRRYDSVGLTPDGSFLLVLPDISRRGLAGAAERLRRELGECASHGAEPDVVFALAHYDFVDVSATEMLAGLRRSMHEAVASNQPLAWS
jgi:GGDEF domain-containing protein